jgi:hypothetical protein
MRVLTTMVETSLHEEDASFSLSTEEGTLHEDELDLQGIWAKRHINSVTLYLAQWHGFEKLTWESAENFAPQILHGFELDYELSIWDYQSTPGQLRVLHR